MAMKNGTNSETSLRDEAVAMEKEAHRLNLNEQTHKGSRIMAKEETQ